MEQGVVVTNSFLAQSKSAQEALKSATLLKSLPVNALIFGEKGTGKKSLATYSFQNSPVIDASNFEELIAAIADFPDIIITSFEKIANFDLLYTALQTHKTRIIATTSIELNESIYNRFFAIKIALIPLNNRLEDVKAISRKILDENKNLIGDISYNMLEDFHLDLSQNAHSLKRSILTQSLFSTLGKKELMQLIEKTIEKDIEGENAYRDNLYIFDVPIIKAGLKRYKSQLKLAEVLGLNRNTLRKKIIQYEKELDDE